VQKSTGRGHDGGYRPIARQPALARSSGGIAARTSRLRFLRTYVLDGFQPFSARNPYRNKMAPSTRGDDEIYDLAEQCARLFKDAKAILSGRPGNQFLVVLEYEQRFQQWAADFGVFAEPRVPIDARLGRRRGLRQVILELLQMLEVNLGRGREIQTRRRRRRMLAYRYF